MKLHDLIATQPQVITAKEPVSRAAQLMRDLDVDTILVVDDRARMQVRGVITDREIALRCVAEHQSWARKVEDFMTIVPLDAVSPRTEVGVVTENSMPTRVSGPRPWNPSHRIYPTPLPQSP